jgi:hypothetical protein
MEFIEELMSELPLSEFKTMLATLIPVDLSEWDVSSYYEAMGLDLEEQENENGDL